MAAAFRWAARLGLHEAVANHFSAAVPGTESRFLLNPKGRHFSRMRATELLLLDADQAGQTDAKSRKALAAAYFQLGELTDKIGDKKEALVVHRKALALRRELAVEERDG